MKYLLDASGLVDLIIYRGSAVPTVLEKRDVYMLDLTLYEYGNALWKLAALHRLISHSEALKLMDKCLKLLQLKLLKVFKPIDIDTSTALEIAIDERISFYDALYIAAARRENMVLVTEDRELYAKAGRHIGVCTVRELLEEKV